MKKKPSQDPIKAAKSVLDQIIEQTETKGVSSKKQPRQFTVLDSKSGKFVSNLTKK